MYSNLFSAQSVQDLMSVLPSLPVAIWETFYVAVVSTALSLVLGLPLSISGKSPSFDRKPKK